MSRHPQWKVYDNNGTYWGSLHSPTLAAATLPYVGRGATIQYPERGPKYVRYTYTEQEGFDPVEVGRKVKEEVDRGS